MSTEVACASDNKEGGTMNRKLRQQKLRQHLQDAPRGALNALADHLGVPYQTIQKLMSGERPLSEKDYDRCLVFLIGYNHVNRRYQGSAGGTVVYPPRFKLLPTATPIKTASLETTSMEQLMKALWLIKEELLRAAGAVPADRHAILDYLHRA
jgi:hypothetical protein